MKSYQRIIFLSHILLSLQLLISRNLFSIVIIFFLANYFFLKGERTQKNLNKITLIETFGWILNTYLVLLNDSSLWFLSLCNLLWLLTSIKIIEVKNLINTKNAVIFIFISTGLSSLFSQNIFSNIIHLICCFLLIYSLLIHNNFRGKIIYKQLIIIISFIPLTFLTYIYLPKVNPWLGLNSNLISETGLNNKLKPGDISSLVQNEELVGRIFFKESLPKPKDRYWRVHVLDKFKNGTWEVKQFNQLNKKKKEKQNENLNTLDLSKNRNHEKWILEPNNIRKLPWSGEGIPNKETLDISSKGTLFISEPLKQRMQYQIIKKSNDWRKNFPNLSDIKIESKENKLLNDLGQKWFNESSNAEEIISKAKLFFTENSFKYTSTPGKMSKFNQYDDFLFNKKSGFCEHFAGSFSLLMRSAKIPSRVVVGYQGGQILKNAQQKDYILIDNSYAHAWSEVWLKNRGWVRIDPTEWIAPERIQNSTLTIKNRKSQLNKFSRNLRLRIFNDISNIEMKFNNFFNKFNTRLKPFIFSKNIFLNRLLTILIFFISIGITLFIQLMNNKIEKKDTLKKMLNFYLYTLSRFNYKIQPGETLIKFSNRISLKLPGMSEKLINISNLYNTYRFNIDRNSHKKSYFFMNLLIMEIRVFIYLLMNPNKSK